jgi:hypothetical protein
MCDSVTHSKITDACADFVNKAMMFTAFDVTKKVWELMGNSSTNRWPKGFHSSIKNDIHNAMRTYVDSGNYEKCTWDVGTAVAPILYFPTGSDPNDYATSAKVSPSISTSDTDGDEEDDEDDDGASAVAAQQQLDTDGKVTPDINGEVHVPCSVLRKAGFLPKDVAYVVQRSDKLALVKQLNEPSLTSYHVDYHCAVRLSRRTLNHLLAISTNPTVSSFVFDAKDGEVTIAQS